MVEFISNLQIWQLVTLQPFDLQKHVIHIWIGLLVNIFSAQEQGSILKVLYFVVSKYPNFNRAYALSRVCINFGSSVLILTLLFCSIFLAFFALFVFLLSSCQNMLPTELHQLLSWVERHANLRNVGVQNDAKIPRMLDRHLPYNSCEKKRFFLHFFCTTSAERTDEDDPKPAVARRVRASVVNQQPV